MTRDAALAEPTRIARAALRTPIGELRLYEREGRLCAVAFEGRLAGVRAQLERRYGALEVEEGTVLAQAALEAYFGGDLRALAAVKVETGGTAFQQRVWSALREIPPGRTLSYGELARRIEAPRAVRAVGLANGQNPVPIVVPCHRVIGADGSLTGYGGGLERKRFLLAHEGALLL